MIRTEYQTEAERTERRQRHKEEMMGAWHLPPCNYPAFRRAWFRQYGWTLADLDDDTMEALMEVLKWIV